MISLSTGEFLGSCILYTGCGLLIHELTRRFPRTSFAFYLLLPFLLLPLWIHFDHDWFIWGKIYLVSIGASWCIFFRFSRIKSKKWPYYVCYLLLFANMIEPTSRLLLSGTILGALNGAACLLLAVLLPPPKAFSIDTEKYHDLLWDAPYLFIFSYFAWQFIFIYASFPYMLTQQIFILLPPLITTLYNRKLFMQCRVMTFAAFMIIGFSSPFFANQVYEVPRNETLAFTLSALFAIWTLIYFLIITFQKIKKT